MKELIEYISTSLVDHPDQVQVTQTVRGDQVNLELRVAREDMGRVIGKNGRVASALRTLLRVAAARQGRRVSMDIIEPE